MGILSRFKDIMASNVHAIFNKEDKHPEKTIRKYMDQLRSDLGQVTAETDARKIEAQRAKAAVDENLAEQEKLERYIQKSKDNGDNAGARQFESRLEAVKAEGKELSAKYEVVACDMENLAAMNDKLRSDLSTLESKLKEVESNQQKAVNAEKMLDDMNEKANYMVDKANALAELNKSERSDYDEVQELASKYEDDNEE